MIKPIYFYAIICFLTLSSCKKENTITTSIKSINTVKHATGFSIENYNGFSILKVKNPWPNATKSYTYILKEKNGIIPDRLKKFTLINVPVQTVIVTSTTHIPSLDMLDETNSLIGFPNLDYISNEKVRGLIESKKIKELGNNQSLNTELIIDLQPNVIIGYGIDNNNPILENLEKNGLKVVLNGDWNEKTPLGKAEWIKFFGAFYNKQKQANEIFSKIETEYLKTIKIAQQAKSKPTILAGDIFKGTWYLPKGESWGSLMLNDANANYLWKNTKGSGSLSLSFETVYEKANQADIWITSGQYSDLKSMIEDNNHYSQFKAFQTKQVYSFPLKKGIS